jgi:Flp pilus assembly protein TadD
VSKAGGHVCRKCLGRNPADRYQDAAALAHDLRRTDFTQRPARHGQRLFAVGAVALIGLGGFVAVRTVLDRNQPPVAGPRTTLDSERRAVEWVYSVGGSVNDTKRMDQLAEPWAVRTVYLHRDRCDGKVTDAGLAQLEWLPDLDTLNLGGAKIDGSGLAHLRESKRLKWLSLECTQVDDAGAVNLAGFTDLTYLNLLCTPVTDATVDVLMKLPRLEMVVVSGTKMTEAGIDKVRAALPSCRVMTDVKAGLKALLELGERHFGKKEWDKAEAAYTEAITLNPQSAEAYHRRAGSRFNAGKVEESLTDFDRAVRLAPKNAEVCKNRGIVYLNLLRFDEALTDLKHALELDLDHPEPYKKVLGETYARRAYEKAQANKVEDAIADFDEALRLDPTNAELFDKLGSLHFNRKRHKEAEADFAEAVRLDPNTPAYRLHLEMSRNPPNPK